jgi:hypothetical protein
VAKTPRPAAPAAPANTPPAAQLLRVLANLEKPESHAAYPGVWAAGDVIRTDELPAPSIPILIERGILMFHLDPDQIAQLPELA